MPLKTLLEFKYLNNTVTKATPVDERECNRDGKCKKEIKIQYENRKNDYLENMCDNGTIVHWVLHNVRWKSVNSVGYGIPLGFNEIGSYIPSFVKEGIFLHCCFVFYMAAGSHQITWLFRSSIIDSL